MNIGRMLERLVLKNLPQRTSQRFRWISGARAMISSLAMDETGAYNTVEEYRHSFWRWMLACGGRRTFIIEGILGNGGV